MRISPGYLKHPIDRQKRSPSLGLILLERGLPLPQKPQADQLSHRLCLPLMTGTCTGESLTVTLQKSAVRNV